MYLSLYKKVEQTWEKLEALQHPPLLAEIHHQVTHVVTGFRLKGEAKGWSHCDAADKERHTETHTETQWKRARPITQTKNKQVILTLLTKKRPLTTLHFCYYH